MAFSSGQPDLTPPRHLADAAARGLELRRRFKRGGTAVGAGRARDLSNRHRLSPSSPQRMTAYFQRLAANKDAGGFGDGGDPSAGHVVRLLWGGDPGRGRAKRMASALDDA